MPRFQRPKVEDNLSTSCPSAPTHVCPRLSPAHLLCHQPVTSLPPPGTADIQLSGWCSLVTFCSFYIFLICILNFCHMDFQIINFVFNTIVSSLIFKFKNHSCCLFGFVSAFWLQVFHTCKVFFFGFLVFFFFL